MSNELATRLCGYGGILFSLITFVSGMLEIERFGHTDFSIFTVITFNAAWICGFGWAFGTFSNQGGRD